VISLRKALGTAVLGSVAVTTVAACASREDGGDELRDRPGCTGVCSADGGSPPGGTIPDSGTSDAGSQTRPTEMSVAQARNASSGTWVRLESVVIQSMQSLEPGDSGDSGGSFWVVDPANPKQGLWVSKSSQDLPASYVPKVGDRIDLEGWVHYQDRFQPLTAWRPRLARGNGDGTAKLVITRLGTLTPPVDHPVSPSTGFGNADGGFGRPNPEYAGSRVHLTGPLALTNPTPRAMQPVADDPEYPRSLGFEVEGGILVRDDACGWSQKAREGGSVVFPQGIRGVWETYAYAPCQERASADAGCLRASARVPGTEGADSGVNLFTYVLHPRNCETDLAGEWDAGP